MRNCCVFCGTREGRDPAYRKAARELGLLLARRGIGLVYGGGNTGLMGAVADAVLEAGGEVTGVFPGIFPESVLHRGLTRLCRVATMHERKAEMERLADFFVALPGGLGTLEEISEAAAFAQLKLHDKPCGLLNVNGYFDELLRFLDKAQERGMLDPRHRALLPAAPEAGQLLDLMGAVTLKD